MEVPALIFTECAVIYNVKDHRNIHWGGGVVSLIDKLGLHFSSMDCSKGTIRPGPDLNIKILQIYCTESARIKWLFPPAVINLMNRPTLRKVHVAHCHRREFLI